MTNTARGEFNYKIGGESLDFALTIQASQMLESMKDDGGSRDLAQLTGILSAMTQGTAKPKSAEQIAKMPITLAEFRLIVKGATEAANEAMPEGRDVGGNASANRQMRRAAAAKKK
jgi:hypothetical protein